MSSPALGITLFAMDVSPQVIPINIPFATIVSSYSLSIATTILSTLIITVRIVMVYRMEGVGSQPRIAVEILVESAALYFIAAIVYIPMIGPNNANPATYTQYAEIFFANMAVRILLSFY
jgi:hypothetical protein